MELYEAIDKRRTIRIFKKGASEDQLRKIILAGTKAPSGGNRQPWEFIIIDDPKIIDQLAELKYRHSKKKSPQEGEGDKEIEQWALYQKGSFRNASVVAVCNRSGDSPGAWLCIENMSLAVVAEGLGSQLVTYRGEEEKEVKKVLGLPENYELTSIMNFGEPGEEGSPKKRRPEFSWLHKNRF